MTQIIVEPPSIELEQRVHQGNVEGELSASERNIEDQSIPSSTPGVDVQAVLTLPVITKLASASFAFFVAGTNDGSLGALIPYMLSQYHISTGSIAILYGTAFSGWILVALTGGFVRAYTGSGGVMVLGSLLQLCSFTLRFWFPPFSVFAVTFFLSALGTAFQDAQANTFVASVKAAHRWLGVIHASYGVGCVAGPLVAAAIASSDPKNWMRFYFFPMGLAILNFGLASWAFKQDITITKGTTQEEVSDNKPRISKAWDDMKAAMREKSVWLLSLFFFFHLGVAITAGGWLVEFLVTERKGKISQVGFLPTVLYAGIALGRLLLVEPTHRFGERRMLLIYSVACLVLQIISWRVETIVSSAVTMCLMGFLLGPFFAAGISVGTKLVPPKLITPALGIIFVTAQAGGTIFPAITGVIAQAAGVALLQPMLIGLIIAMGIAWAVVPPVKRRDD